MREEIEDVDVYDVYEDFDSSKIESLLSSLQENTENPFCVRFCLHNEDKDEPLEHPGIGLIQKISEYKISRPINLEVCFPSDLLLQAVEGFFRKKHRPRRSSLYLADYTLRQENMLGILTALKGCADFTLTFSYCTATPGFFQALQESSQSFPKGLTLKFIIADEDFLAGWDAHAVFSLAEIIKNLKSSEFYLKFDNFMLKHDEDDDAALEYPREIYHQVFQASGGHSRFLVEAAIKNPHVKGLQIRVSSSEADALGQWLPQRPDLNLKIYIYRYSTLFEANWPYFLKALALPYTCLRNLEADVNGALIIKSLYTNKSVWYLDIFDIALPKNLLKNLLSVNYDLTDGERSTPIKKYRKSEQKEAKLSLEGKAWLPLETQMERRAVIQELASVGLPLTINDICCEFLELELRSMTYLTDEDVSLRENPWRSGLLAWRYSLSDSKHSNGTALQEALADCFAHTLKITPTSHFVLQILSQLLPLGIWSEKTGIQHEYMLQVADAETLETTVKPLLESLDMDIFGMELKYLTTSAHLYKATQINLIAFFCMKEALRREKLPPLLPRLPLPLMGQVIEIPAAQYNIFWVISLAYLWQGKDNFKRFTHMYHNLFGKKGQVFSSKLKARISVNDKSLQRRVHEMLSEPLLKLFKNEFVKNLVCGIFRQRVLAHGRKFFTEARIAKMGYSNWAAYEKATESSYFKGGETEILWSSVLLDCNFKIFSKHYCYELGSVEDSLHQPIKLRQENSGNRYCLIVKEEKQGNLGKRKTLDGVSSQLSTRPKI